MQQLTIGKVADQAGVGVETIRYYEREGLLPKPARLASGYRQYEPDTIDRLRFIRHAKELGFSLDQVRELLSLRLVPSMQAMDDQACEEVHAIAQSKLVDVDERIRKLQRIQKTIRKLCRDCEAGKPTDACPILRALDSPQGAQP